jgi:hypothetical protein
MTLSELQAIVLDIESKSKNILNASRELVAFITDVKQVINSAYGSTINVDDLVALQTPIYTAKLTALEQACDQLGTDALA